MADATQLVKTTLPALTLVDDELARPQTMFDHLLAQERKLINESFHSLIQSVLSAKSEDPAESFPTAILRLLGFYTIE
jgi:hypothetical protein